MTAVKKILIGAGVFWITITIILGYFFDAPNLFQVLIAEQKLKKINSCLQNSDCADFSYNNGCNFASINSSANNQALKISQNINGRIQCDYFARKVNFSCENHKCVPHENPLPN